MHRVNKTLKDAMVFHEISDHGSPQFLSIAIFLGKVCRVVSPPSVGPLFDSFPCMHIPDVVGLITSSHMAVATDMGRNADNHSRLVGHLSDQSCIWFLY